MEAVCEEHRTSCGANHGGVNHMKKMREVTVKLIKNLKFSGTKFDIRHN
jgi:hypothetical protein